MGVHGDDDATLWLGNAAEADPPGDGDAPATVGRFRLVQLLGEGGMGRVYLAEQSEPIRRQVALKLVRAQLRGGRHAEVYFEIERQALARMDHPAIARVFDAGSTPEGHPWFAMEYIRGEPLNLWLQRAVPDRRERLEVFLGLLRGVAHAHQRGVIHRDLKPSNVLVTEVDGRPQAKLIDFGIAIGIDALAGHGGASERTGSARYMSPEQHEGRNHEVAIQTDLYSLGVMLLELLLPEGRLSALGEPVPQREQLHALVEGSLAGRPAGPLGEVPWELRHIVERALRPTPALRYPDAQAMASDIEAWLKHRPLQAVPHTRGYVASRFVRRNRLPVALTSAAALALVLGLGAALWGLERASQEAERSRATADFLATLLSGVDPDRAREHDKTLLLDIINEASTRAAQELAGQPAALAEIEHVVASSLRSLDEFEQAHALAQSAYERARAALGPHHPSTLDYARNFGRLQAEVDDWAGAESRLRDVVETFASRRLSDHPAALQARQDLGWVLRGRGDSAAAHAELSAASGHMTRVLGTDHEITLETRFMEAITLADLDRFDEAVALVGELIHTRSEAQGGDHPRVLAMRNSRAVFYLQAQRFAEAEEELRAILPDNRRVFGDGALNTVSVMSNLAGSLRQQGKIDEAGPYYREVAERMVERFGPTHLRALQTRYNHANWLRDSGALHEALVEHRDVTARLGEVLGDEHVMLGEMLTGYGATARLLGAYEEAETALLRALEIRMSGLGPTHSRTEMTREGLRSLYEAWGRPEAAAGIGVP